jgi:hypothetical protein
VSIPQHPKPTNGYSLSNVALTGQNAAEFWVARIRFFLAAVTFPKHRQYVNVLTGRQAFQGETISDVASVLAREPDLALLPVFTLYRVEDWQNESNLS